MFQEDWLMRQVRQLAEALLRAFQQRDPAAEAQADQTARELLGMDLATIRALPFEEVAALLAPRMGEQLARMWLLEARGRYDAAEDELFALVDAGFPDAVALGLGFYDRMRALPDDVLEAGGLPRDEVEQGAIDLLSRG